MEKIVYKARVLNEDEDWNEIPIPENIKEELDGKVSDVECYRIAQYIPDDGRLTVLHEAAVYGGVLSIHREGDDLYLHCTYETPSALNAEQLDALGMFTEGQYSDGAGNGWMQDLWYVYERGFDVDWQNVVRVTP